MTVWTRAAIVLSIVGVALLSLAAVSATGPIRAGADMAMLVPVFLGVGLKGVLALMAAAVMAWAARLEGRRRAIQAARAAFATPPTAAPQPAVAPAKERESAAAEIREAA
jgi:hypothetical protein